MITISIILITVGCSYYAWNNSKVYSGWMLNPYMVSNKNEYYRFITSGFIHADQMHLFFNMLSFFFFGLNLEREMSPLSFIAMYLLAIVISDLPSYLKHKNSQRYNSLGASGAVSAVIFGSILYYPLNTISLFFIINMPGFVYAFLFLIYSYYMSKREGGYINHDAHFYGAVFGVVFILLTGDGNVLMNFIEQIRRWPGFF
jgi:membrane associated rhomboid family serine protease